MAKIVLHIKNSLHTKEHLNPIEKPTTYKEDSFTIYRERPLQQPIISKAPLGAEVVVQTSQILSEFFRADVLLRLAIEGVITNSAFELVKNIYKTNLKFFSSNNKQRGNKCGARIDLNRTLPENQAQILSFLLDDISEDKLLEAVSKIQEKVERLDEFLGELYIKQVKYIGFIFNENTGEWTLMGVEKFDGSVDMLS